MHANSCCVSTLQIRDVPDDLKAILKKRAADAGQSLSEYALQRLRTSTSTRRTANSANRFDGTATSRPLLAPRTSSGLTATRVDRARPRCPRGDRVSPRLAAGSRRRRHPWWPQHRRCPPTTPVRYRDDECRSRAGSRTSVVSCSRRHSRAMAPVLRRSAACPRPLPAPGVGVATQPQRLRRALRRPCRKPRCRPDHLRRTNGPSVGPPRPRGRARILKPPECLRRGAAGAPPRGVGWCICCPSMVAGGRLQVEWPSSCANGVKPPSASSASARASASVCRGAGPRTRPATADPGDPNVS